MEGVPVEGIYYAKAAAFLGASIAMGMGAIGPALGQGLVGMRACENIGKYPESSDKIRNAMIMACALVESAAVYSLGISAALIWVGFSL